MAFGYFPYMIPDGISPNIYDANGNILLQIADSGGTATIIKGQATTTDNLEIYSNSVDTYPKIRLLGGAGIYFNYPAGGYFVLANGATVSHRFTYAANVSTIQGTITSGDDMKIKANYTDNYPFIDLLGNGWVNIEGGEPSGLALKESGNTYGSFEENTDFQIQSYTNRNIFLDPNGAGLVKFGTYTAGAATDSIGYISILDAAGNSRKLMVQA